MTTHRVCRLCWSPLQVIELGYFTTVCGLVCRLDRPKIAGDCEACNELHIRLNHFRLIEGT